MSWTMVNLRLVPATDGQYAVWLIGSGCGLDLSGHAVVPRRVGSGQIVAGLATPLLLATSKVTPAGTVYRADLFAAGARVAERRYFTVPVSAVAVEATDWATVIPGTLGPADIKEGDTSAEGSVLIADGDVHSNVPSPVFTLPSASADAGSPTPTTPARRTGLEAVEFEAVSRRSNLRMLLTPFLLPFVGAGAAAAGSTVSSVNSRTGDVTGLAEQSSLDTTNSDVAANTAAIDGKQTADPDLAAIAALDATIPGAMATDGAGWVRKTYAQMKTALGLVKADVGLGSVDDTADTAKPVSTAGQAALDAKVEASRLGVANGVATLDSAGKITAAQALVTSVDGEQGPVSLSGTYVPLAGGTSTGEQAAPSLKATGKTGAMATPITLAGGTVSGAPTTGPHTKGELVFDDTGAAWYCTVAGMPGTWVQTGTGLALGRTSITAAPGNDSRFEKALSSYAVADGRSVSDITVVSGSRVITSAGDAKFSTTAKVGMSIIVGGANGGPKAGLRTTITQVISDTQIQLEATPRSSQTAAGASWGTDAGPGLQAAFDAATSAIMPDGKMTVLIDGEFYLHTQVFVDFGASPNFFGKASRAQILGRGVNSALHLGSAGVGANNSAITLTNADSMLIQGIRFVGTNYVATDCKAAIYCGNAFAGAVIRDCTFLGLSGSLSVVMFYNSIGCVFDCNFVACTTSGGAGTAVIWGLSLMIGVELDRIQVIDSATVDGVGYSTAVKVTPTPAWIRVDSPNVMTRTNARSQTGIYIGRVILDEASTYGIQIVAAAGSRWQYIDIDGTQISGGYATSPRGISITRAARVKIRNTWAGYRTASPVAAGIELIDAGYVEVENVQLSQNMNTLTADAATTKLTIRDCSIPVLTSSCPTVVVTNGQGGVIPFTKAGVPSDTDFIVAPPVGTVAVDTTAGAIYVRTAAATWKSVALG